LLFACKNFDIPVVLVVPAPLREKATRILGDVGSNVHVTAPEDLEAEIRKHL
jgi:cysteine synthase